MPSDNLKVTKVVISLGLGEEGKDKKTIEAASQDLQTISGQKPKTTRARLSIAGFKTKKGDPIGLMITLRGRRMRDFLKKLFTIVLPRLRDFRGVSLKGFDKQGNYNLGISEQIVFPEIDYSKIDKIRGLQITMVTNADAKEEAKKLLAEMGMPFEHGQKSKNP